MKELFSTSIQPETHETVEILTKAKSLDAAIDGTIWYFTKMKALKWMNTFKGTQYEGCLWDIW